MVDATGFSRRVFILPGEVSDAAEAASEKSAEVIVVGATSYAKRGRLTTSEGLNVKLFQML